MPDLWRQTVARRAETQSRQQQMKAIYEQKVGVGELSKAVLARIQILRAVTGDKAIGCSPFPVAFRDKERVVKRYKVCLDLTPRSSNVERSILSCR
jgi:hypothetical protein